MIDSCRVFGSRARDYERVRPGYLPGPVRRAVGAVASGPIAADIASGTGKLGEVLARMGLRVLAVEPDAKMAAVAAAKGMRVEITSFEDWRPRPASFDLLACGQAWHWLDPAVRAPQAARCLKPGGGILLAWNLPVHPPEEEAALETVYHTALGPDREDVAAARQSPIDLPRFKAELVTSRFVTPEEDLVTWHRTYTAEEWCGLVGTQSGTLSMPPYRRARLLRLLHEYIERRHGGRLRVRYDYRIVSARLAV